MCVCVCFVFFLWCSDEDMQSLASLMSMKQADIGNLDDFEEENEEDEENRVNQEEKAAKITGKKRALSTSVTGDDQGFIWAEIQQLKHFVHSKLR